MDIILFCRRQIYPDERIYYAMKKFSAVTLQIFVVLICLILPISLLFVSYARHVTDLAITESEKSAQTNMAYVKRTFDLLADYAQTEAVRISSSKDYITAVNDLASYDQIIQNVDLKGSISDVANRLATVQFTDDRLRNVYLHTLGTDYVLTSDRGILQLSTLSDTSWLDIYQNASADAGQYRTQLWSARISPGSDLLSNGSRDGETPIISYILPVRIANSRHISLLIMNYYETKLASLINVDAQNCVYLIDKSGRIICHPQLELLGKDVSSQAYVQAALDESEEQGHYFDFGRNGLALLFPVQNHSLYSYYRTAVGNWILINENTLLAFTDATVSLTCGYVIALFLLFLIGGALCLYGMRRIMSPIKKLSLTCSTSKDEVRNEILLIEEYIHQMQQREHSLLEDVLSSQNDMKKLYLLSLLHDEPYSKAPPIDWKSASFMAVVFELDGTAPNRDAQLSMLLFEGASALSSLGHTEGVPFDRKAVCFLINAPKEKKEEITSRIVPAIKELKRKLSAHIPLTFTAGIGMWEEGESGAYRSYRQAMAACRQRILLGRGQIVTFSAAMICNPIYRYPKDTELQLINAITAQNRQALFTALSRLKEELLLQAADSILQIFRQLNSAIAAYLIGHYDMDDIFDGGLRQWFAEESSMETLDELLIQLKERAERIMDYLQSRTTEESYIETILRYIAQHYTQDIDFEQMSETIGISYSYVRRIVKAKTNQSLLEIVHHTRIEKAKELLKTRSNLSIRDIADSIGYHNIQSFNRFFKKFEGISPSEYRAIQS